MLDHSSQVNMYYQMTFHPTSVYTTQKKYGLTCDEENKMLQTVVKYQTKLIPLIYYHMKDKAQVDQRTIGLSLRINVEAPNR